MRTFRETVYKYRMRYSDKIFDAVNLVLMCILVVVFAWPLWFVLISAFSDPSQVYAGKVLLFPKGFTTEAFQNILEYGAIWTGYRNTLFYTLVGTFLNVIMTVCAAYPLSRNDFAARKVILYLLLFTMYFNGGLVPTYMVVKEVGLIDTPWAMIIPGACSVYNVLITRTYFKNSIPETLFEAARLDGANSLQYLMKIALPLSKPILAVIGLYYAVGHWNDYYTALIYLRDVKLLPLQSALRDILLTTQLLGDDMNIALDANTVSRMKMAQTMRYSSIIVSVVPVLMVYPFVQKYFVKGVMIGSIKE